MSSAPGTVPEQPPPARARRWRFLGVALAGLAVVLLGGAAAWWWYGTPGDPRPPEVDTSSREGEVADAVAAARAKVRAAL